MAKINIPDKIHAFNVYVSGGTKLLGISDEVTLPELEAITDTLSGPGILGEIESPSMGHFGSLEIEIPFQQVDESMFLLIDVGQGVDVVLRGSIQFTDSETMAEIYKGIRIEVRGRAKKISLGKAKQGAGTKSSITMEIARIAVIIDNKTIIELDKFNFKYVVNGKDLLEKVRKLC